MSKIRTEIDWDLPDPFVIEVVVSAEDVDGYGHVNNAVYVAWLNRCAFEHSSAVGLDANVCRVLDRGMATIRHEIDYLASGYLDDEIVIGDWVTFNDAKLRAQRRFQIVRKTDNSTLVRSVSNYVCTKLSNGKPVRMPDQFKSRYSVLPGVVDALQ